MMAIVDTGTHLPRRGRPFSAGPGRYESIFSGLKFLGLDRLIVKPGALHFCHQKPGARMGLALSIPGPVIGNSIFSLGQGSTSVNSHPGGSHFSGKSSRSIVDNRPQRHAGLFMLAPCRLERFLLGQTARPKPKS